MKAIKTAYHGPGNVRGATYSARDSDGNRVSVHIDHALNSDENHRAAKDKLCQKMNWPGEKMQYGVYDNDYYWVFIT